MPQHCAQVLQIYGVIVIICRIFYRLWRKYAQIPAHLIASHLQKSPLRAFAQQYIAAVQNNVIS
jgi:uncharacterized protein YbdZ (MbtH family)